MVSFVVQRDSSRKTNDLKKKIIREYIYVGCTILVSYLLPLAAQVLMGDKTGLGVNFTKLEK